MPCYAMAHTSIFLYNGWKRIHCLKYHSLVAPDGLAIHVYGPVEGRRHDETLYKESGLSELLKQHFWSPEGNALCIYGDPAYGLGPHLLSPYKGAVITEGQSKFNSAMSKVREVVEWSFKEITQQFGYLDFKNNQKVLLQPCGLYYMVSVLLCNAHTILHLPQIPQYFNCRPPSLEEYFQGEPINDDQLNEWAMAPPLDEVDIPNEDFEAMEALGIIDTSD